jgi:hypothetical protein
MAMKKTFLSMLILFAMIMVGCAPKVMIPPKIDLSKYEKIGLLELNSNSEGNLTPYLTERLLQSILEDQPGIMVVELGREEDLLYQLGFQTMTPDAIRAIGDNYNIKTILSGIIDFTSPATSVDFSGGLKSMSVTSSVSAMLTLKMRDSASGVTVWSGSSRAEREISDAGFFGGTFHFDAENPEKAYGKLADKLVRDVTKDFRVTYERRRD